MNRIFLPNGCSFTPPIVTPANWLTKKATTLIHWRIRYRYYDPIICPEGRQFTLKEMNGFKVLEERQTATKDLIRLLTERLKEDEWNPVTNHEKQDEYHFEVDPKTPVNQALEYAYEHKVCAPKTRAQLRQVLKHTQVTRRWRLLVKRKLGIEADLYSLKHSHTTEVVSLLSSREAAAHNGHADETMVTKIYDIKHKERQDIKIRTLNNPL